MPLKFFRSFSVSYSGRSFDSGERTIFSARALELLLGLIFVIFIIKKLYDVCWQGRRQCQHDACWPTFGEILTKLNVFA